jgi:hypothetical protein
MVLFLCKELNIFTTEVNAVDDQSHYESRGKNGNPK